MRIATKLLVALAIWCCSQAIYAVAYKASSVTMRTENAEYAMSFLGVTSDGYQVWAYQTPTDSKDLKDAEWQIDGGSMMSVARSLLSANTLFSLSTTSYGNYTRELTVSANNLHLLKVKSQTSADFFTWDMATTPAFASQFTLAPEMSAYVADSYYGDGCYIHKLAFTYTNVVSSAFESLAVELSYDNGVTWTSVQTVDASTANVEVKLPLDKRTVRYRVTAYPKSLYKVVMDKDSYTSETDDSNISALDRVRYNASSVVMNTGQGSGTDISMTKLGVCKDGYQIWACRGTDAQAYTKWTIDNGSSLSCPTGDFYSNTEYKLTTDYSSTWLRYVPQGSQHYHFLKVKGKEEADYFTWYGSENFNPYSYCLALKILFKINVAANIDDSKTKLEEEIQWDLKGIRGIVLSSVDLDISLDGGKTWGTFATYNDMFGGNSVEYGGNYRAPIWAKATTVRYRVRVYPADTYKMFAENGCWTYETDDHTLSMDGATCSISDVSVSRSALSDASESAKKTYTANLSWTAFETISDKLGGVEIQYSTDNGETWAAADTVTTTSGTHAISIPAGYTHYTFRVCPYGKDYLADFAVYRPTATSETFTMDYSPAVASLSVASVSDELEYDQFRRVTLNYALNDDLWHTCSEASIAYSYDDGATWMKMNTFTPQATGSHTIMVDASEEKCKFRILVNANIDGKVVPCTLVTDNVSLNKQ